LNTFLLLGPWVTAWAQSGYGGDEDPEQDGRGLAHCLVGGQGSGEHLGAALVSVASAGPWR